MEAILEFVEDIYDFIVELWDYFTSIIEWIAEVISMPVDALTTLEDFSEFFPSYVWVALIGVLGVVVIFRLLKIFLSGG